ncbi:TetR/AcrR family transcriptional regulator [Streptomyces sp. NPDC059398]|uniref:TetR/AcrR family transcriptional regulator n=1 Tax=Streptomyces sp. NPDC059398 TaxID=3346820 RepID=UPI00368F3253
MTDEPDRRAHYREPRQARSAATLARVLRAAEELVSSVGLEDVTITGVAERAGVSVGSIYRRFDGKEQLIAALTERMLERREEHLAEQLRLAEPSLSGVLDAYTHTLVRSFADTSGLFPDLLRVREAQVMDRGSRTMTEVHRLLLTAAAPYTGQIRRPDPGAALDTVARALLGACFHNSIRPDRPVDEESRSLYADELTEMALAYLLSPGRRSAGTPKAHYGGRGAGSDAGYPARS